MNPITETAPRWNPQQTRACVICLARFEGEREPSFSIDDRTDNGFVQALKRRGVPDSQLLFLQDEHATKQNIRTRFAEFLQASDPAEMLLFYVGSHGSYQADKQAFWFSTYDDFLPFEWVFDTIEQNFRGTRALLFADTCYSGGMIEMIPQRKDGIAYAGLSSTFSHNLGWSGWRFITTLQRGLEGHAAADLDGDGAVDLRDLAHYSERYMGFVAEGKPLFGVSNGFKRNLILADVTTPLRDLQIGQCVQALSDGDWYKAEILDVKGSRFFIHYTDYPASDDEWVAGSNVRAFVYPQFWQGAHVEVQGASSKKWYPARVRKSNDSMHYCTFDDYGPEYDEWVGPSRIRGT